MHRKNYCHRPLRRLRLRAFDVFGVRPSCNHSTPFARLVYLVDVDLGEGEAEANFLRDTLDLDFLTDLGARLIRDMDVYAHAGLVAQVVSGDGHAAHPINDGRSHRAVQALAAVHVVLGERQAGGDMAFACRGDDHGREEEFVDWASREAVTNLTLDVQVLLRRAV